MVPLVSLIIDALFAPTKIAPVIPPLPLLEIDAVFPELLTLIAVPLDPALIEPVLVKINEDPPSPSPKFTAIEAESLATPMLPALIIVRVVFKSLTELTP